MHYQTNHSQVLDTPPPLEVADNNQLIADAEENENALAGLLDTDKSPGKKSEPSPDK